MDVDELVDRLVDGPTEDIDSSISSLDVSDDENQALTPNPKKRKRDDESSEVPEEALSGAVEEPIMYACFEEPEFESFSALLAHP